MKLSIVKGIAHDFLNHLNNSVFFGHWKDFPSEVDRDLLSGKGALDREAVAFFKERLPKSFNFSRIQNINLNAKRSMTLFSGILTVVVDDKTFTSRLNARESA